MIDRAASVLARLRNKANESGRSYQLCLQLFCQEEFLRRLANSKYADNFVLKGGLFLYSLTLFDSRITKDIDFLLRSLPFTPEHLKLILEDIIMTTTDNDIVTYEIRGIEPTSIAKKYGGVKASMIAKIKNIRVSISIDIGIGDIIVPKHVKRKIVTQLPDFDAPMINTYSIETTVAEKLDAILSLMEFSSRMKDYYDIYYIASRFDIEGQVLTKALMCTFSNREHHFTPTQFHQITRFSHNENMVKKWHAFVRKTSVELDDYSIILDMIDRFLRQPLDAAINNTLFNKYWSALKCEWI